MRLGWGMVALLFAGWPSLGVAQQKVPATPAPGVTPGPVFVLRAFAWLCPCLACLLHTCFLASAHGSLACLLLHAFGRHAQDSFTVYSASTTSSAGALPPWPGAPAEGPDGPAPPEPASGPAAL